MKKFSYIILATFLLTLSIFYLTGCGGVKPNSSKLRERSALSDVAFQQEHGFQRKGSKKRKVDEDMVFIDGGSTIMGVFGENVNNSPKKEVTVTSFYMKETEVVNWEWQVYLQDLKENYSDQEYNAALLNENVWVTELGYNDPYVYNYSHAPGFRFYPVVGVSWTQATNFCNWLTEKVNSDGDADGEEEADGNTDGDNAGNTDGAVNVIDKEKGKAKGLSALGYRLPTEAEWEYAARAMVGTQSLNFVQATQRVYPWGDGLSLRGKEGQWQGRYLANFKRSKGNYKGVPGESNSSAPTTNVREYPANDLGLYDMGGNVSEWVTDIYRPLSFQDFDDFNPIRRDDTLDPETNYDSNNSLINNKARVYKGASWKDCAYWAQIGTRRFFDQDSSTATIGFRYAMTSLGDID